MTSINNNLLYACVNGNLGQVKEMVASGADLSYRSIAMEGIDGLNALDIAAATNQVAIVTFLLSKNAEIDDACELNYTALHRACMHGAYDSAFELIKGGANLFAQTISGAYPLTLADKHPDGEISKMIKASVLILTGLVK